MTSALSVLTYNFSKAISHVRTHDFEYHLPPELIAQTPAPRREQSRLMVLDRSKRSIVHDRFDHLQMYLAPGDVLAANRSRVIPARLQALKQTGGVVELLLTRSLVAHTWLALARPSRKLRAGMRLSVQHSSLQAVLEDRSGPGEWVLRFEGHGDIASQLLDAGTVPLPPYIRNGSAPLDRYQTVYADRDGSIAAPTAGLHFSVRLLDRIRAGGTDVVYVTLHVGPATFKPVTVARIQEHHMEPEWGDVPEDVARRLNEVRSTGHRAVAVGTTTTRLLESTVQEGQVRPFRGECGLFIYPGFAFQAVDALLTNFHLPRSTLLMLVSAFAGRDFVLEAYAEAIAQRYRFYSFGDAMLIL